MQTNDHTSPDHDDHDDIEEVELAPPALPDEVAHALDDADLPGRWEYRDGVIYVGIDGSFDGSPLELSVITDRLAALTKIAEHLRAPDLGPPD